MKPQVTATGHDSRPLLLFLGWALVGLLAAFGIASLLTIGVVFLLAALALGGFLVWRKATGGGSPLGLAFGAALLVGYLGWLNRGGPGTVCHANSERGFSCTDEWSPWPFFVVAAVLAAGAIALFLARRKG